MLEIPEAETSVNITTDVLSDDFTAISSDSGRKLDISAELAGPLEQGSDENQNISFENIELVLESDQLDDDENGLYISGIVVNRSNHPFDAVRIEFELCDKEGKAYSSVTETSGERMELGDSWGFTIYIPYSEMDLFSSYKLHSIMGTTK